MAYPASSIESYIVCKLVLGMVTLKYWSLDVRHNSMISAEIKKQWSAVKETLNPNVKCHITLHCISMMVKPMYANFTFLGYIFMFIARFTHIWIIHSWLPVRDSLFRHYSEMCEKIDVISSLLSMVTCHWKLAILQI